MIRSVSGIAIADSLAYSWWLRHLGFGQQVFTKPLNSSVVTEASRYPFRFALVTANADKAKVDDRRFRVNTDMERSDGILPRGRHRLPWILRTQSFRSRTPCHQKFQKSHIKHVTWKEAYSPGSARTV